MEKEKIVTHYASIFAKFNTEEEAQEFLVEHAINQSIPKGGPVFSFSRENEGPHRDRVIELEEALSDCVAVHEGEGGTPAGVWDKAKRLLA